jgi:hypothetical protein
MFVNMEAEKGTQHHLIYIPGLNDQYQKQIIKIPQFFWKTQGFYSHVIFPEWEKGYKFAPKLKLITDKIDELINLRHTVSLVGQSAGGSAALIAFCERRDVLNGVVNATGRMRAGEKVSPTLEYASRYSPAFKEAVLLFEHEHEPSLTSHDRAKIMTIRPRLDRTVPPSTVPISGAINLTAPMINHSVGGFIIISSQSSVWLNFLRNLEKH